eukprot:1119704-Pelagomonas_calceolata.AAC.1
MAGSCPAAAVAVIARSAAKMPWLSSEDETGEAGCDWDGGEGGALEGAWWGPWGGLQHAGSIADRSDSARGAGWRGSSRPGLFCCRGIVAAAAAAAAPVCTSRPGLFCCRGIVAAAAAAAAAPVCTSRPGLLLLARPVGAPTSGGVWEFTTKRLGCTRASMPCTCRGGASAGDGAAAAPGLAVSKERDAREGEVRGGNVGDLVAPLYLPRLLRALSPCSATGCWMGEGNRPRGWGA